MKRSRSWLAALAALTLILVPFARAAEAPKAPTRIENAASGEVTEKGKITGEEFADYAISAEVGQSLSIVLEANSKNCHFNLIAPSSPSPIYNSTITGDRYRANVRESGDYVVRVYIVRRGARKGESASYSIAFRLAAAQ